MPKRSTKKPRGGRPRLPAEDVLRVPLTIHFSQPQIDLITQAAALDDDVRGNWSRRMLVKLARERIAQLEMLAALPDGHSSSRSKK